MLSFLSILSSLGFKSENTAFFIGLAILLVVSTFFYIKLDHKFELMFKLMSKDISHIKKDLSNHITDTNKKIDKLENNMKENFKEVKSLINKK